MNKIRHCLVPLLAFCLLEACARPYPSDAAIIASFHRDQLTYEQLARMVQQDPQLKDVNHHGFWSVQGDYHHAAEPTLLSSSRWAVYRQLFFKLDLDGGVSIDEGNVFFSQSAKSCFGVAVSGRTKGVAFLRKPPRYTCRSLDSLRGKGDFYRHLQGHWYLFLSRA
jgi:hypothetical protein